MDNQAVMDLKGTSHGIGQGSVFYNDLILKKKVNIHHICGLSETGFSGGAVVENLPAIAGDTDLNPGPRRSHMPRSN